MAAVCAGEYTVSCVLESWLIDVAAVVSKRHPGHAVHVRAGDDHRRPADVDPWVGAMVVTVVVP